MKLEELTETCLQEPNSQIVIELSNGQIIATNSYYHSQNGRGEQVIVIRAGRKIGGGV